MKLGTYTTLDCPTKNEDDALSFLKEKFGDINGVVRRVMNTHELCDYPSFEIDYPSELEDHSGDDCETCEVGETSPLDVWHEKANEIESYYSKKFGDNL